LNMRDLIFVVGCLLPPATVILTNIVNHCLGAESSTR
jgi:hypothetical protein